MSEFYIIKPAVDTKETGHVFPAVESYEDYDFNSSRSVHKLTFREFPDFEPDIRFKLVKGAKLCDVMGQAAISAHGLLISENLKNSICELNIPPNMLFPATLEDQSGKLHQYYWLHVVWRDDHSHVDWEKSNFIVKKISKVEGPISLYSFEDYSNKSKELGKIKLIKYESMSLKNIPFDIFTLPLETNLIGNKNAYEALKNFTGISIEKVLNLDGFTDQDLSHLS